VGGTTDVTGVAAADRAHVWHPYTQHGLAPDSRTITRASGAYLYDDADRPIFDAISSWWVTLHGHAQPEIAAAIAEQAARLDQVIFAGFTHEPAARLAEDLLRIAPPGLARVFYSDDGSTAVEAAVKMALQYWRNAGEDRRVIVALEHAYHGDTFGAMSVSARSVFTAAFDSMLFDVVRLPDPSLHDTAVAFAQLLAQRGHEIAAIIVEPMLMGAGGMRMWTSLKLAWLRDLARQHGVLFIADEVLTGFGRTGPLFACEHAQISPDIMCVSKGITGGVLPLGATLATEAVFDRFRSGDRAHTLFHGHSYTANPIACAAARASIALLNDHCTQQRTMIEQSHLAAAQRFSHDRRVEGTRVLGTVMALEISVRHANLSVRHSPAGYLHEIGQALRAYALERGVLLRPLGNTVYFLPPYCSSAADLGKAYDVLTSFLDSTA
jgi:adenosylmethionine-8-amino-7-oxononanoate aminotransferase